MATRIRDLEAEMKRHGFLQRPGKGSHRVWWHPRGTRRVAISGKGRDDADHYQIKQVREAIAEIEGTEDD